MGRDGTRIYHGRRSGRDWTDWVKLIMVGGFLLVVVGYLIRIFFFPAAPAPANAAARAPTAAGIAAELETPDGARVAIPLVQGSASVPSSSLASSPSASPAPSGIIINTVDDAGLHLADGQTVQLLGIDVPEPDTCYGTMARWELRRVLTEQRVQLDGIGPARYVFLSDGTFINLALIAGGSVRASSEGHPQREAFLAAQQGARDAQRGLWLMCGS